MKVRGIEVRCGSCLWWDESQSDQKTLGECRRHAPAMESALDLLITHGASEAASQIENGPWGKWPWTRTNWYCGDHVPRNGK